MEEKTLKLQKEESLQNTLSLQHEAVQNIVVLEDYITSNYEQATKKNAWKETTIYFDTQTHTYSFSSYNMWKHVWYPALISRQPGW